MRLVLIDAGGTISATDRGQGFDGGDLSPEALAVASAAAPAAQLEVRRAYRGLSEAMHFGDAFRVVDAVRQACDESEVEAILVAHGTDAMEEVAFLADLLIAPKKPVIFTGAQRAPSEPGYDGLANLGDAVRTALRPEIRGAGVLIVFGGLVLTARKARKVHTEALQAFGPSAAVIGRTDQAAPLYRPPAARAFAGCDRPCEEIEIVTLGLDGGHRVLELLAETPVRGVVLQALGCGNASEAVVRAVRVLVEAGLLVGVTSGCFEGRAQPVYASGHQLAAAGALFLGDLDPRRARLLFACALGDGRDLMQARQMIEDWLRTG